MGRRPGQSRILDESESEEVKIGEEILAVPESPISYIGAQVRGARMSLDGSLLSERQLDARQMGRQAAEAVVMVNNNNGPRNETMCREVTSSQCRLEENNAIRGGSDPLVSCTRASEQIDERDVNRPVHVREIGRRGDNRSQSDSSSSSSDESGGRRSPDRRSPEDVGRQRVSEKRRSPTELGRHGSSEYRQSLEDLRTEFSEELRAQKAMFLNVKSRIWRNVW